VIQVLLQINNRAFLNYITIFCTKERSKKFMNKENVGSHLTKVIIFTIGCITLYIISCIDINITEKAMIIGVLVSLLGVLLLSLQNNKNLKTDIIIKKAQFTNEFIFKFKEHIPNMVWNSFHSSNVIKTNDKLIKLDERLKKFNKKLCNEEEFASILYEEGITEDEIYRINREYFNNYSSIEKHIFEKPRLSESINYNIHYTRHMDALYSIKNEFEIEKLSKENKKNVRAYRDQSINNILTATKEIYANTFNDLECISHFVMFNLIDIEKITDLIYNPFSEFVNDNYIFLMSSIIKGKKSGNRVYSNIILLDKKIKEVKEEKNIRSNKIKEKHIKKLDEINQDCGEIID